MADAPERPSSDGLPNPVSGLPPLTFRETDPCPGCGKEIKAEALVCVHCGYDFRKGAKVATAMGVEHVAEPAGRGASGQASIDDAREDLITPGRGSPKVVGIGAAVLLAGACVAAGFTGGATATRGNIAARVASTAVDGVLHSLTGLIALSAAAFYFGMRLGRVELGGARIAAAWCVFLLVSRLPIPAGSVSLGAAWLAGMLAYFLVLWALMARHPRVVGTIAATHFGLFGLFQVLVALLAALQAAAVVAVPPAAGPTP
ncbi:MAG: hypothetical protein ACKVS8_14585 [Phycisphaerales bacterium]